MARPVVPWDSEWRQIPDFPMYWINQYGQFFNMKRKQLIKSHIQSGYEYVFLFALKNGRVLSHHRATDKVFKTVWPEIDRKVRDD
jgi:hypothetical protein